MNKYLHYFLFRNMICYLQKTLQKQSGKQSGRATNDALFIFYIIFFLKSGFILLTAFKAYCAHKPSDPTCVYDKYSGKILRKDLQKKLRPALSK